MIAIPRRTIRGISLPEVLVVGAILVLVIGSALTVSDGNGNLIVDAIGTITFVEITFVGEEEEYNIVVFVIIPYDEELGLYTIGIPTLTEDWHLEAGYYDVWFGFDDGTTIRHRIEIIEPVE